MRRPSNWFSKRKPLLPPKRIEYEDLALEMYCPRCHMTGRALLVVSVDYTKKQRQQIAEYSCPNRCSQFAVFYDPAPDRRSSLYAHMICTLHAQYHEIAFVSDIADEVTCEAACDVCKKGMRVFLRRATDSDRQALATPAEPGGITVRWILDIVGIKAHLTFGDLDDLMRQILEALRPNVVGAVLFFDSSIRICLDSDGDLETMLLRIVHADNRLFKSAKITRVTEQLVLSGTDTRLHFTLHDDQPSGWFAHQVAAAAVDCFSKGATWCLFRMDERGFECFVDVHLDEVNMMNGYDASVSFRQHQLRDLLDFKIEGYSLRKHLGAGASADVFLAEAKPGPENDVRPQSVAIKVYRAWVLDRFPEQLQRIDREVAVMRSIRHGFLVPVFDRGIVRISNHLRPYVVMEAVQGITLTQWVQDNWPVTESCANTLLKQVCAAVDALHEHGVCHRDLKPDNIMIRAATGEPVVMDFGVIKVAAERLTESGEFLGTRRYAAPEYLQSSSSIDFATVDVYGIGGIGYYLVQGEDLFTGAKGESALLNAVASEVPVVSRLAESRPLRGVIELCLQKDPARRPATVRELISRLENA